MYDAPVAIDSTHDFTEFNCGNDALNEWLGKKALQNEARGATRTFVVCQRGPNSVAGFFGITVGGIARDTAATNLQRNMPDPIPVAIIGRLAVDLGHQGKGLARSMAQDAVRKALLASRHAGMAAVVVQAKDQQAAAFWQSVGFDPLPAEPLALALRIKDAVATFPALAGTAP